VLCRKYYIDSPIAQERGRESHEIPMRCHKRDHVMTPKMHDTLLIYESNLSCQTGAIQGKATIVLEIRDGRRVHGHGALDKVGCISSNTLISLIRRLWRTSALSFLLRKLG
jgi:hypothetical protein